MHVFEDIAMVAEQTALEIAWQQWAALGAAASPSTRHLNHSLVDPEALLLLSLYLVPSDPPLKAALFWWVRECSGLTSIHRLRRLSAMYPQVVEARIQHLAALAVASGDHRWRALATKLPEPQPTNDDSPWPTSTESPWPTSTESWPTNTEPRPTSTEPRPLEIMNPAALVLRVRLVFGISPKADMITCMLSRGGQTATSRDLVNTTRYARATIHRILESLVTAGIVARAKRRPATYLICSEAWQEVFGRTAIRKGVNRKVGFRRGYFERTAAPMWLCWPQLFSYLTTVCEACRIELRQTKARQPDLEEAYRLHTEYRHIFLGQRLPVPALYSALGPPHNALLACVEETGRWVAAHA